MREVLPSLPDVLGERFHLVLLFVNMPERTSARIRPYTRRDEREVRFMIGQAQMEPLAYANHYSETFSALPWCGWLTLPSVFSSIDPRCVDRLFVHFHSLHELVAKL